MVNLTEIRKQAINNRIFKNREEISRILFLDWPIQLKYIRIEFLKNQNENLIKELKSL